MSDTSFPPVNIAIIGASGYTGAELIRLLYNHPSVVIRYLIAETSAGQPVSAIYPHFAPFGLPDLVYATEVTWSDVDIAFCCMPHGLSQAIVAKLPEHIKVIDLSADFRIEDIATYEQWYGTHHAPQLQPKAVYGLSELNRKEIADATLIACPGCYPTCSTLPLIPLLHDQIISPASIIIDAKSGISGAGRSVKQPNLFCEVESNVRPYSVNSHRHMPEIEQTLSRVARLPIEVQFAPQVVPLSRGMLTMIYVTLQPGKTLEDAHHCLNTHYDDEYFITVLPQGQLPSTREVMGTNRCHIGITAGRNAHTAVVVSVIDNLVKGASGQAVQNLNILLGLPEYTALDLIAVFP